MVMNADDDDGDGDDDDDGENEYDENDEYTWSIGWEILQFRKISTKTR